MATIKCKGLTGVQFDVTVTYGITSMNVLKGLIRAIEGDPLVNGMYGEIVAEKDSSINLANDGAKTLMKIQVHLKSVVLGHKHFPF